MVDWSRFSGQSDADLINMEMKREIQARTGSPLAVCWSERWYVNLTALFNPLLREYLIFTLPIALFF